MGTREGNSFQTEVTKKREVQSSYLKHEFSTTRLPTEKSLQVFMLFLKQDKEKIRITR